MIIETIECTDDILLKHSKKFEDLILKNNLNVKFQIIFTNIKKKKKKLKT